MKSAWYDLALTDSIEFTVSSDVFKKVFLITYFLMIFEMVMDKERTDLDRFRVLKRYYVVS